MPALPVTELRRAVIEYAVAPCDDPMMTRTPLPCREHMTTARGQ